MLIDPRRCWQVLQAPLAKLASQFGLSFFFPLVFGDFSLNNVESSVLFGLFVLLVRSHWHLNLCCDSARVSIMQSMSNTLRTIRLVSYGVVVCELTTWSYPVLRHVLPGSAYTIFPGVFPLCEIDLWLKLHVQLFLQSSVAPPPLGGVLMGEAPGLIREQEVPARLC